jgi:hypothetical protein
MDSGVRFGRNAFFASAAFITQTPPALASTDRDGGTCKFQKKSAIVFYPKSRQANVHFAIRTCSHIYVTALDLIQFFALVTHLSLTRQGFQQAVYVYMQCDFSDPHILIYNGKNFDYKN